ncbi:MAG TPA: hypothetical protein VJT74_14580, partial [Pyrinomonadaceae bacterium]|nr:hypothetical protein [Pyrinomonadaceae bacterium]
MSRTLLLRLIALMALLAFPATLRADQLRVVGFNSGFGAPGIENQVRITIEFGPSDVGPPLVSVLDIIVGTADIGRTYTLSSGPVFEAAARFLTDGENGQFGYFHFFLTGEKIG